MQRPHFPALPNGRLATLAQVLDQVAYDVITVGAPRRSCRVTARTEREARILGAVQLNVELERVVLRPEPYSLQSLGRA